MGGRAAIFPGATVRAQCSTACYQMPPWAVVSPPVHARADAGCLACNGQANETQDLHIEPAPIFSADRSEMFYADPLPNPL
jgi:hypothetical protein